MTALDSRLHQSWLCQLAREHHDICCQYRVALRPPIFTLSDCTRQLGSWSAEDRVLSLSRHLIAHHPWSLTLQVLKHEMAHQLVSELDGADDAGHGPLFRQACRRLGLDAPFHRASADLAETVAELAPGSTATEQGRQIIDKVRKLMALGGSDNEHEAALAVRRAAELLARHRLDFAALAEDQGLVHRTIDTGGRTLPLYRKAICVLLEQCFQVRVVCASLYQPLQDASCKTIELFGREEQVAIAEHCCHFLENRLQTLWEANRHRFAGNGRIAKKSYFLGLLAGFRQTLDQGRSSAPAAPVDRGSTDLPALQEQQRLDDFVALRFPRLRRMRRQGATMDRTAYHQALRDGRGITMNRPMTDQGERPPRLLPPTDGTR